MHPFKSILQTLLLLAALHLVLCSSCPLPADSPCHCGVKNDTTSYVQCSGLGLFEMPKFTLSFTYDELHLTDNYISRIEDNSFSRLRVRKIYFTGNPISHISESAFKPLVRQLELLHLDMVTVFDDSSKIESMDIMRSFCLPRLVNLRLKGFQLERLPTICPNSTRLSSLALISCDIHHKVSGKYVPFSGIKDFDLSGNPMLFNVPNDFANLELLNMSGDAITRPFSNLTLKKLKTLDLSKNGITKWIVPTLRNLQNLILDGNELESLAGIKQYPTLTNLSIRSNKLTIIQEPLLLPSLEFLDLTDNEIVSFSFEYSNSNLKYLILALNEITTTPATLPISIEQLDLSNNQICSFSAPDVYLFTRIKNISISGNPLFCDCNIRWLQMELVRRNMKGVVCSLPVEAKRTDLLDLRETKCVEQVPECVKTVHGLYLRTMEDFEDEEDVEETTPPPPPKIDQSELILVKIKYLSSYDIKNRPMKSLLMTWTVGNFSDTLHGFTVTIIPRITTERNNSQSDDLHYSTHLPSSSRHYVIHGVRPELVYSICLAPLTSAPSGSKFKVCETWFEQGSSLNSPSHNKDISTSSKMNDSTVILTEPVKSLNSRNQNYDILILIAACVTMAALIFLSCGLIIMAFNPRRRKEASYKSAILGSPRNIAHHYLSASGGGGGQNPQIITSSTLAADPRFSYRRLLLSSMTPDPGCCCYGCNTMTTNNNNLMNPVACEIHSNNHHHPIDTTDTRITVTGTNNRHVYHELLPVAHCEIEP